MTPPTFPARPDSPYSVVGAVSLGAPVLSVGGFELYLIERYLPAPTAPPLPPVSRCRRERADPVAYMPADAFLDKHPHDPT